MSVENLSNQIRLMNKAVKRELSTDPSLNDWLINKLATMLDNAGTTSILHLSYYSNPAANLSFFYDSFTGHVYEDQNPNVNSALYNAGINGGALFTLFSRDQRELDQIYLFFTKDGFPVFWNISKDQGSDWVDVRGGLIFVGSVVLAAVGAPIASQIGSAVLGPTMAASYPALATGIGQAAMSTLMNGGDIQKGVTSAVASYVGAGAGSQVATASGIDALGSATAAATRAFINGGDVTAAVTQSLLQNGVSSMQSLLLSGTGDSFDATDYDASSFGSGGGTLDDFTDEYGISYTQDAWGDWSVVDIPDVTMPNAPFTDAYGISYAMDAAGDWQVVDTPGVNMGSYYTDENGITYGVDANGDLAVVDFVDENGIGYATDAQGDLMVVDAPTSADISQSATVTDNNGSVAIGQATGSANYSGLITSLATTALSLVGAYVKAGAPAIRAGTATTTVNSNGTVTTRNANGTVTVSKPAVGTPYVTAGGSLVTNNGDGTYTTVNPNGQISTQQYAATSSSLLGGMNQQTMMMLGLGLVAAVALSSRK